MLKIPDVNRSTYLALGAMALGVFVIANDITAMNVALPAIEKDFDTSVTTVQWAVSYTHLDVYKRQE